MKELIRFDNLHKSFGTHRVYEGLSLHVLRGETLAVMGASGTGKSVLLKTLIGLLAPDEGQVLFEGEDVRTFDDARWRGLRQRVAMVFQGAALFDSMTVFENVAYPLRLKTPPVDSRMIVSRVKEVLSMVNLSFEQVAALRPVELSGGMARRVGLARALAVEPEVILWDEPTAGLDPQSRRTINTLIVSMKRRLNVTSMVVTHDLASAFAVSDRLALLANRRIVEVGNEETLRASTCLEVKQFLDERALEA